MREVLLFGAVFLLLGAGACWLHPIVGLVPLLAMVWLLWFFRDPSRRVPAQDGIVIAPADGKVVDIEEVTETEYLGARALRIGIFLSVFNVHVNRSPVRGDVELVRHCDGKFRSAFTAQSTAMNESNLMGIRSAEGCPVLVKQIAGAIARRIVCAVRAGDSLAAGQRFGMIKFGSRTEVYVPADRLDRIAVAVGSRVRAGESILGVLR